MFRAVIYLLAITVAEAVVIILEPVSGLVMSSAIGIACHIVILLAVIIDAARISNYIYGRLVLSLAIVPLIRIISLSLPLADIPQIWQYPIVYVPLLATAIVLVRTLDLEAGDVGIRLGFIPLQLAVGLVGVGLGIVEYLILTPEPLVAELTWQTAWLPALILLLATGFVEEFIFRGVLQRTAIEAFGSWGIVYVSSIFAVLHIGWIRADSPLVPGWMFFSFLLSPSFSAGW